MGTPNTIVHTMVAAGCFLLLGASGFSQAADVYHLEDNLYAVICEDGHIFSYQGTEDRLSVVVPALCEEHGGVAASDGAAVTIEVPRRPEQAASSRAGTRPGASSSAVGPESATGSHNQGISTQTSDTGATSRSSRSEHNIRDTGSLVCWGRRCPAGSEVRAIDRAMPALVRAMTESCGDGSGKVNLTQFRQASVHQCPIQRTARGQFEEQRRR